jgi:acyl-CoA-binding protein
MSFLVANSTDFDRAVDWVNENYTKIPKDNLLRLYAYYKIANGIRHQSNNKQPIVSAFKANAIMQVAHLSDKTARNHYAALVEKIKLNP